MYVIYQLYTAGNSVRGCPLTSY